MKTPKIITICGSSKFVDIIAVVSWILERTEKAATFGLHLLPDWYSTEPIPDHLAEHEGVADQMDELHLKKISISDEVFVVDFEDYIGSSTSREIEYAKELQIPIRYFTSDPVGRLVREIINTYFIANKAEIIPFPQQWKSKLFQKLEDDGFMK